MSIKKQTVKVLVAGDGGVGKTTIVYKILGKDQTTKLTPGLSIESLTLALNDNLEAEVVFWDLGGQPQFRFFQEDYIYCANLILFIYDLNRYHSLSNLEKDWIPMLEKNRDFKEASLFLIGNKLDLGQSISDKGIEEFLEKYPMKSIKVSATEGTNIEELYNMIQEVINGCD